MANSIFVVIVTYNGSQWLERCLNSILASNMAVQIVIVDNCSNDETIQIIEKFDDIYLIKSDKNLGFGQGNNIGIKYALQKGADYIFLVNQDVYIRNDTVDRLVQLMEKNPLYGIISPLQTSRKEDILDPSIAHNITPPQGSIELISDALLLDEVKEIYEVNFINAASWFIRADVFAKVGFFDPVFFHYGEDDNYAQRVRYHGLKIGICPLMSVIHDRKLFVGNVEMYLASSPLRELLKCSCDINRAPSKTLRDLAVIFSKSTLRCLAYLGSGKFQRGFNILGNYAKFLFLIPSVLNSRVANSRTNKK